MQAVRLGRCASRSKPGGFGSKVRARGAHEARSVGAPLFGGHLRSPPGLPFTPLHSYFGGCAAEVGKCVLGPFGAVLDPWGHLHLCMVLLAFRVLPFAIFW